MSATKKIEEAAVVALEKVLRTLEPIDPDHRLRVLEAARVYFDDLHEPRAELSPPERIEKR